MTRVWVGVILIVLLAFLLRIYRIESVPPALNWDEVSIGYNAYSIMQTGRDEWDEAGAMEEPVVGPEEAPAEEEMPAMEEAKEDHEEEETKKMRHMEEELAEAIETINTLKSELHEINLLNSKLLYTNKIFKAKNLTEAQKVKVLTAFDKAETVKEVKLVFETLNEGLEKAAKKELVKESKGFASKPIGSSPKQPAVEVNPIFERMRKLAGL